MIFKKMVEREFEAVLLHVDADVRYWEDADIKRLEDTEGVCFPSREGDSWRPLIELDNGRIINWKIGETASLYFKVCDAGVYTLFDSHKNEIIKKAGYVPDMLCLKESGYGDYIIMDIDEDGIIKNWKPSLDYFIEDD